MMTTRTLRLLPFRAIRNTTHCRINPLRATCNQNLPALQSIRSLSTESKEFVLSPLDFDQSPDHERSAAHASATQRPKLSPTDDPRPLRKQQYQEAWNYDPEKAAELATKKLNDPRHLAFIPGQRRYPREQTQSQWVQKRKDAAWALVVADRLREHKGLPELPTFSMLMKAARELADASKPSGNSGGVAAMRVVLPKGMNWGIKNEEIGFLDGKTGVMQFLKMGVDMNNPSAGAIMRGKKESLARVTEELILINKDIQISQLGNVSSFDYESRQLWPLLPRDRRGNLGADAEAKDDDNVWVHREDGDLVDWDFRLDEIPLPGEWTAESFHDYVMAIMKVHTPPHIVRQIYAGVKPNLQEEKIKMLKAVFSSKKMEHCITPGILNNTLSWFQTKGGHRKDAEDIFKIAKQAGVPVDTASYNILLGGYAKVNDVGHFFATLLRMKRDFIPMNNRTWLHLLDLVKNDKYRREVIMKMLDYGDWQDTADRRQIASTMASYDLHYALNRGVTLDKFMKEQAGRYGKDWFTKDAAVELIAEYLRFHRFNPQRFEDIKQLVDRPSGDGIHFNRSIGVQLLKHAAGAKAWEFAFWTLEKYRAAGIAMQANEMGSLLRLSEQTVAPHALAVLLWHGSLSNGAWPAMSMNKIINQLLLGDADIVNPAWREFHPPVLDQWALKQLKRDFPRLLSHVCFTVRMAVQNVYYNYGPKNHIVDDLRRVYHEYDEPIKLHMEVKPETYDPEWKPTHKLKGAVKEKRDKSRKERMPAENSRMVKNVPLELVKIRDTKEHPSGPDLKDEETVTLKHTFQVPYGYENVKPKLPNQQRWRKIKAQEDRHKKWIEQENKVWTMHS